MSLSLKESCLMYERYCRRHSDTPTFEAFNAKHYTCLPQDDAVFADFKRVLTSARRSAGVPVTRRLPSLWSRLSGEKKTMAVSAPSVQVETREKSFRSSVPKYESALRNNVRPPQAPAMKLATPKAETWTVEAYKKAVTESRSVLLKEAKNLIVHLIPETKETTLESLACKLTKSTWESLRGKSQQPLKMRDGTTLDVASLALDECDLAAFVQNRKKKKEGPYFVRFSRI
ncbi:hypothetical protein N9A45_01245 [bacterium]|nr:hypothetical protein [bacterium]